MRRATPEQMLERADDVSMAFLAVLERLAPEARAAFLLREVFDADYERGGARPSARARRPAASWCTAPRTQVQDQRPRFTSCPRDTQQRLLRGFAEAAASGEIADAEGAAGRRRRSSSATAAARCRPFARCCAAASASRSSTTRSRVRWAAGLRHAGRRRSTASRGCCASSMARWSRRRPSRPTASASCASARSAIPTSCNASRRSSRRERSRAELLALRTPAP